jgi:hypothetical protein
LKRARILIVLSLIFIIFVTACTQGGTKGDAAGSSETEAPQQSAEIPASPTASLSPAPIPTTPPDTTPVQSASGEPSETQEAGKVPVADGFYYFKLNDRIKKIITGMSYPADDKDCSITYGDLRYIRLRYYDFNGNVHDDGELIVNAKLAKEVTEIFYKLYKEKYPFTSVKLVDYYGEPGNDDLSMAANNTSAFNYRYVTGTNTLSKHSYGRAIDINPMMNPYIKKDGSISPPNGAEYVDRSLKLPGMIDPDDLCYKLFIGKGWKWGGYSSEKDYQHFSKKQ